MKEQNEVLNMDINEITARVEELSTELGGLKNAGLIMGGINPPVIEKALEGDDDRTLNTISNFFESRDHAFEIYSDEQIKIIKSLELALIDEGSASNLAQKLNMSQATLSSIRRGKYTGSLDVKFNDIKDYLELREEKATIYINDSYIPTYTSQKIYEHIRTAHIQGGCVMITGDAGIGKTETIKEYKRKNPNRTIVIEPIHLNTGELDMLELLADEIGIDVTGTKPSRLYKKILNELYSGLIIIVDEVQKLSFRAVDTLRSYSDVFKSKGESLGIAFIGNDVFRQQFYGKRGIGKEQVWNRCIERPKFESKNIPFSDIEMLFPILARRGMKKELMFLHAIALSPKEDIRTAVNLFTTAYNKNRYNLKGLVKQAKYMNVELENLESILRKIKGA